jgi:hypothetical protein
VDFVEVLQPVLQVLVKLQQLAQEVEVWRNDCSL